MTDDELLEELSRALTETGELVPTDEEEVRRAEEADVEAVPLPAALERPPGPGNVVDLASRRARRRALATHVAALAIGAAATLAITVDWDGEPGPDLRDDPAGTTATALPPPPVRIALPTGCDDCCAGSDCPRAAAELRTCPSGRRCIACDPDRLAESRYRLRLGAIDPAEAGREAMKLFPQGEPEICVRVGASPESCRPTLLGAERWNTLPLVAARSDLSTKVSVRLRWKGVKEPLATAGRWTAPVAVTPTALCKGYTVRLESDQGELFGTTSLFLDDAHFVELGRAADPAALRAQRERLVLVGLEAALYETTANGDDRFALAFGPFDRRTAESLRWQLLEQHQPATASFGADFRGDPLPLP